MKHHATVSVDPGHAHIQTKHNAPAVNINTENIIHMYIYIYIYFYKALVFQGKILNFVPLKLKGDCRSDTCFKWPERLCKTDTQTPHCNPHTNPCTSLTLCCTNPYFENFQETCESTGGLFIDHGEEQSCYCPWSSKARNRLPGKFLQRRVLENY